MMRAFCCFLLLNFMVLALHAQEKKQTGGIITGNVLDSASGKAIPGATVQLKETRGGIFSGATDKNGAFYFDELPFGLYSISISVTGMRTLRIDSINVRTERFDFNLGDIKMSNAMKELETVTVYAEKPLIQSKDGNITFNAGESALAAGSNASELLENVPLVTKDPNGKILVRGKEPKILIDDKPVELNLQQLQDLLESLPGSAIEKIEVMTNPPPQYANEQGGVINITTKKGRVGMGGRINVSAGTRGEGSVNGSFNYRKNKFSLTVNGGVGLNNFEGDGNSSRKNIYADSVNYFNTRNTSHNKSVRPNFRVNVDYELTKNNILNLVANYNSNTYDNENTTEYTNLNRFGEIFRLSERTIESDGSNDNFNLNITYTRKGKTPGEQFRVITGTNLSLNDGRRLFYQQFFNPDHTPNGLDSTQEQLNENIYNGHNVRLSYDRPFSKRTSVSVGASYHRNNNHIDVDANYLKKPDGVFVDMPLLSNEFKFHQDLWNARVSLKQLLGPDFSVTAGLNAELTAIGFELMKEARTVSNDYISFLPFGTVNKNWKDVLNLTLSYRRTIRRPGVNELNPTIDFSDPYNVRFGNYQLDPSLAHNFDLVVGKTTPKYFANIGLGYNLVEDIFSTVRTLLSDGKTQITWENISDRREYEISSWNGYTISKKLKINLSASYVYNEYDVFERTVRKFRNGGSFTSNLNGNYNSKDIWNFTGNFTMNRFANPQGAVNWNLSMNIGVQKKFFNKKFIVTVNFIDPFREQQNESFTYGTNFELRSFNTTRSRNVRLSLAYNFTKQPKKLMKK